MRNHLLRTLALVLCCVFLLSGVASAMDMGVPPGGFGGMGEPPGGFGGMDMSPGAGGGAPPMSGAPTEAAIVIVDGQEVPEKEYEAGKYSDQISVEDGVITIRDLELISGDYSFNGIVATGTASVVRLEKATIRLGVERAATNDMTGGAATNIDSGAALYISDSQLVVDGSARYVTANYNDAVLVVNDSSVISTGSNENTAEISEPFSNEALLISGNARSNFSIGATKTYYFNSVCTAEGWAALSTDSATGSGLDLYAYNTEGVAENGGYSTYADTNCRVWLYGSRLTAAEISCIISKSGQIHAYNASAADAELLKYNEGETVEEDTALIGGRNAVMIHAPDMMGQGLWAADCGTFTAEDTLIATSKDLVSTKDYYDYGEAVGAYVDYVMGDVFLIKSTSANIDLKNVEMESYNGVLVHTVLNSDSMGNFLAAGDGAQVNPVAVTMTDMDVSGDILHEDYQRKMTLELRNATLSGNIVSGTVDSWNEKWTQFDGVNWVVDETYDAVYGVTLTVGSGATWNVTGESTLTGLTVEEDGYINGEVTVDGEAVTPLPGETYTGVIQVSGDYVEEPEVTEAPVEEASVPEEPSVEAAAEEEAPKTETAPETPAPAEPAEMAEEAGVSTGPMVAILAAVIAAGVAVLVAVKKKK